MRKNQAIAWSIVALITLAGSAPYQRALKAQAAERQAGGSPAALATAGRAVPPVVEAAKNKDRQAVRALLQQRVDVNARQGDGATALHWAAYWDDGEVVDLLLRAGAAVNAANDYGATPLWLASGNGNATVAEALLRAGADPNAAIASGETPLMTASRSGNVAALKSLLARGANANAKERLRGQTALMWAAAQQHPEVVQVLIENGADVQARSLVRTRRVNRGPDGTSTSLNPSRDLLDEEQGGFTPLLFAARQGSLESARLLVAAGANVNDASPNGTSALVVATHSGHSAFANFLLEKGADPNAADAGYTALHAAVLRGDLEVVKALVARGANTNAVLMEATPARRASQDWAMNLSWVGATPLWLAARFAEADMMRILAANGADSRFAMKNGTTMLMAPLGGGADRRSRVGLTLFQDPAETERRILAATGVAADFGVDVNAANESGDTALHTAASRRLNSVVQFLVERGAALDVKNKKGQTPLALATASRGNPEGEQAADASRQSTADLLRKLGARE